MFAAPSFERYVHATFSCATFWRVICFSGENRVFASFPCERGQLA
jgi:hypothetical protein